MLPKKSGLDVLRSLRELNKTTPVIVLSAREHEYDKVAALRLGADDYVTKPFALAELLARVHAVLRRANLARKNALEDRVVRFGDVVVNLDTREVQRDDEVVRLTNLEFELLRFFLTKRRTRRGARRIARTRLGVTHGGSKRTVDNFVAQLRSKLRRRPGGAKVLRDAFDGLAKLLEERVQLERASGVIDRGTHVVRLSCGEGLPGE
nr:transcriptional regulatory protein DltR-like [Nerophis lumbriciformis]